MDAKEKNVEHRKLIDALYEFCSEYFSVSDDTILDKLFVHIAKKSDQNDFLELSRDLGVWLEKVVKLWDSDFLCGGVKVLSVRLMGLIGSKPYGFSLIKHILPDIERLVSNSDVQSDSSLMVPLINDLALFLVHEEGLDWLLNSGVWKHAVKTYYDDCSIYTNRSAVKFISLLLNRVGLRNKHECVEILNFVCKPLVEGILLIVQPLPDGDEGDICSHPFPRDSRKFFTSQKTLTVTKQLTRAAKYVSDILDEIFSSDIRLPIRFAYDITTDPFKVNCQTLQEHQTFLNLIVLLELSNACWARTSGSGLPCLLAPLVGIAHDVISTRMSLGQYSIGMDFCFFCLSRIHRARASASHIHNFADCPKCCELESMFVNELKIFLELHKHCGCHKELLMGVCYKFTKDLNTFKRLGLTESVSEECLSEHHLVSDRLRNNTRPYGKKSLHYLQLCIYTCARSLDYVFYAVNRESLSWVIIKSFDSVMEHFRPDKTKRIPSLMHLIGLASKLTESPLEERISQRLITSLATVLEEEKEDTRLVVSTLQLLNKVLKTQVLRELIICPSTKESYFDFLKKSMPPIRDSLISNLKHSSWEVRDTSLEVYHLVIDAADLTPGLFWVIYQDSLAGQVLDLAANDPAAYVRSSAFKFFAKIVRAKIPLESMSEKLSELASQVLLEDEMPEPRMAACDLLAAMYVTNFLLKEGMPRLYDTVYKASLRELDWEVRKATLRFWQCTITKQVSDEGVPLDPSCLRSDSPAPSDVAAKIVKVMGTLNDAGCFKVIWMDVNDDSDISVSEEACRVIDSILDLDKKWKFIDRLVNDFYMDQEEENQNTNTKEENDNLSMNEEKEENMALKRLSLKEFFINIRQDDWRIKLEARKNWIENTCDDLSSLLDHILKPDQGDYNAIDCY